MKIVFNFILIVLKIFKKIEFINYYGESFTISGINTPSFEKGVKFDYINHYAYIHYVIAKVVMEKKYITKSDDTRWKIVTTFKSGETTTTYHYLSAFIVNTNNIITQGLASMLLNFSWSRYFITEVYECWGEIPEGSLYHLYIDWVCDNRCENEKVRQQIKHGGLLVSKLTISEIIDISTTSSNKKIVNYLGGRYC